MARTGKTMADVLLWEVSDRKAFIVVAVVLVERCYRSGEAIGEIFETN
jgi:hypothetical protein